MSRRLPGGPTAAAHAPARAGATGRRIDDGTRLVVALALLKLGLHLATNRGYGYFGDELYFLSCANRLAWGYVDLGPAAAAVLAGWKAVFGDSLFAIRLPAALAGTATVVLTAALARMLGGGSRAQALAALAVVVAPGFLIIQNYYSMNALDTLAWALAAVFLLRALQGTTLRDWAALGVVLGVGLLNKLSVLWLGGGIALGLVLVCPRRLATPGPWVAAAIALALAAPYAVWEARHGWPTVDFVRNDLAAKLAPVTLAAFLLRQAFLVHPAVAPVAVAGLGWLLVAAPGPPRVLGIVYVFSAVVLFAAGASKAYYLLPAYPPLLAAGGLAVERAARRPALARLPALAAVAMLSGGAVSLPFALPMLSVERLITYEQLFGFRAPVEDRRVTGPLPGHFANMQDWPAIVDSVAAVQRGLPQAEQSRAVILADDYMEAGALDVLGRRRGLAPVVGTQNSWGLWGAGAGTGDTLIVVGGPADVPAAWYERVVVAGTVECGHCLPWRSGRPIYVARVPRASLAALIAARRHFD